MNTLHLPSTRRWSGLIFGPTLAGVLLGLCGCESGRYQTTAPTPSTNSEPARTAPPRMTSTLAPAPALGARPYVPAPPPPEATNWEERVRPATGGRRYSFVARDLDLRDALALFARNHDLNIIPDPDVVGSVTVDFKDLPLEKSLQAILGSLGYFAQPEEGLIRVSNIRTKVFTVDYLRLIRSGNGTATANISSGSGALGSSGGGSSGSTSGDSASVSINKSDSVDFWSEVEEQLRGLLSEDGNLTINRVAGTIMVTDRNAHVDRVGTYLEEIKRTLHRQVDLEAQIYEVVLTDEFHFGIDWQNVIVNAGEWAASSGGLGTGIPSSRLIVDNPIGGSTPSRPAMSLAITKDETKIIVDALKQMGNLEVVSQPRIRTLNNQAALIKIGTDKPFFRKNTVVTSSTGGTQTQTDVEVRTITIGTILSVTPQISDDGWITMDISPVITRLVATASGPDESTAPEVDIKQASSLVRIPQGSTVIIGGLIQNEHYKSNRKVPILGDIPVLGAPFRGVYDETRKTELVIFITPTLVP